MHIGVVATMKGGLEHFIYREIQYLEAEGAKISLFPTKQTRGLYQPLPTWNVHSWNLPRLLLAQLYWLCRKPAKYLAILTEALRFRAVPEFMLAWNSYREFGAVDVIYSTFGDRKLFLGYFAKRITGKPLAVEIHAYELYRNPNPRLFERALAACDRVIAISEHNRQLLIRNHGVPASRIHVVRCSIDLEDYRPTKKFVILIVGFFVERKGHEILFRAIKELDRSDIEVWVVGDTGNEDSLDVRQLANEVNVADKVAFFGRLNGNALKAVYRACDVFCLPCHTDSKGICEGFPSVLIEAMACGKPIITTRHVEIPRVIPSVLVDEKDVAGLAEAISTVLASQTLREQLGQNNRKLAEEHFSSRNASRTLSVFRELTEPVPDRSSSATVAV